MTERNDTDWSHCSASILSEWHWTIQQFATLPEQTQQPSTAIATRDLLSGQANALCQQHLRHANDRSVHVSVYWIKITWTSGKWGSGANSGTCHWEEWQTTTWSFNKHTGTVVHQSWEQQPLKQWPISGSLHVEDQAPTVAAATGLGTRMLSTDHWSLTTDIDERWSLTCIIDHIIEHWQLTVAYNATEENVHNWFAMTQCPPALTVRHTGMTLGSCTCHAKPD